MKPSLSAFSMLFIIVICSCRNVEEDTLAFPEGSWIDLSHDFSESSVYWPTAENFQLDTVFAGMTDRGFYYSAFRFCAAEHGGTHVDAPVHFARGRQTVDEIPLERLIGPVVVVDVSDKALKDPDYQVSVDDFREWEKRHGPLPEEVMVLIYTGYARFWPDRLKYMGTAERGEEAVAKLHFPGIAPGTARWLVEHRRISAIGLDTPSIDYGQSTLFESHRIFFEHNIPGLENINRLEQLPARGALAVALPMKIKGGSGGPLRIVALVPETRKTTF